MTKTDSEIARQIEQKQQTMLTRVRGAVREGLIFKGHDRTTRRASIVSAKASRCIDHLHEEKDQLRDTQRTFFNARRKIAEAAIDVAADHKIEMELVDVDSDDEIDNYLQGHYNQICHKSSTSSLKSSTLSSSNASTAQSSFAASTSSQQKNKTFDFRGAGNRMSMK